MNQLLLSVLVTLIVMTLLLGIIQFALLLKEKTSSISAATSLDDNLKPSVYVTYNGWLRRTKLGKYIELQLDRAGSSRRPLDVLLVIAGLGFVLSAAIWRLLAPALAVLGLVAAGALVRVYVSRLQQKRKEKIITQLPETARVLANASQAGLSLASAIEFAATEVPEPSKSEMQKISDRLKFGVSVETALEEFRERIGSREAGLLISTLVVSSTTGGSLVSALQDISLSLDQRKEVRRQMVTIMSESRATANFLVLVGVGSLFLVNLMNPGTVEKMTTNPIGIAALAISGALFAVGWMIIQRMAKVDHD